MMHLLCHPFFLQEWEIEAENGGKIKLTFERFDVEPKSYWQTSCSNDYVEVSYGSFSQKFCGNKIPGRPGPFISSGDTMTVKFHSDTFDQRSGFSAVWTEIL